MAARLLLLFIIAPIIELYLLIKIGGMIGVIPTIALVLLTAIIGSQLVRRQGLTVMNRIRAAQMRGEAPALEMIDGAALLLAGFFLMTPGFISDALGFLLLIPRLRARLAQRLLARVVWVGPRGGHGGRGPHGADDPIEGEYRRTNARDASDRSRRNIDHDDR